MSDVKVGGLDDCPCATGGGGTGTGDVYVVDAQSVPEFAQMKFRPRRPPKPRKPRSKGKGAFCVLSHKGRVVHCYESEATAKRVANAFTKRGRAGTKFHVKKR